MIVTGLVLSSGLAGCGSDPGDATKPVADEVAQTSSTAVEGSGATATTTTAPVGTAADQLVSLRRPMTDAEAEAILDDAEDQILRCADPAELGAATWDYGPVGADEPRGRKPDDALADAIADLAEDTSPRLGPDGLPSEVPTTGWVELDGSDPTTVVFVHLGGPTNHLITVDGDPDQGVWRHSSAVTCQASS